jgi:hypothetical protein
MALLVGVGGDVTAEVAVGNENHFIGIEGVDHLDGVGAGAADVAFGLDRRRGVDVGHHRPPGEPGLHLAQALDGDHVGHRAAGVGTGQKDDLLRRQNRRAFGHEMNAAENDHLALGARRFQRQGQGIAGNVGHGLNLVALVVVRQQQGIAFLGQPANFLEHFFLSHRPPSIAVRQRACKVAVY